jgi:hypothetical protein
MSRDMSILLTCRIVPGVPTGSIGMAGMAGELPLPVVQVTPVMPLAPETCHLADAGRERVAPVCLQIALQSRSSSCRGVSS